MTYRILKVSWRKRNPVSPMFRRAVVRLHGYNQEIEVKQAELEPSLGQEAIDLQMEQAEEDLVSSMSVEIVLISIR
jgi:phosphoribosylformylglycinamidine (FGAM) synthase-like amidotransferase family enzyme